MQVLSATASLILLFFLKSLLSLPFTARYAMEVFLIFFLYYYLFDSSVFAKHSVFISRYIL